MDEEIKTQANDELAQALASVSDDTVADLGSPRVAASSTTDDDFSDFMQSEDRVYNQSPVAQRDGSKSFAEPQSRRAAYVEPAQISTPEPVIQQPSNVNTVSTARLEDIKERALQELRPLMESIDIPSTEKYETYLMMLRASDDQSLIEPTFKAARMIEDDKLRAKALLDIVHEINYLASKA